MNGTEADRLREWLAANPPRNFTSALRWHAERRRLEQLESTTTTEGN